MKKRTVLACCILFFCGLISTAQAAHVMTEFGLSPFHKPPLTSVADFQAMVDAKETDIRKGLALSGREDLIDPFFAQVKTAPITIVDYPKDTTMQWMFYKKKGVGEVKVVRDVLWANDTPFAAVTFDLELADKVATIIVPLECGNVALLREVAKPQVVVPPNQPPTCVMTVAPEKAFCGEPVTINAGASSDPDGTITRMTVAIVDEQGNVVSQQDIEAGVLVAEVAMPCGNNTVQVTVYDNEGAASASDQCVVGIHGMERIRVLADVGFYRQFDPGTYLFGRVGAEYRITEAFSVIGMVGVAPHIDGSDGETAILVDVLGEYGFGSQHFVNFGLGGWITDGDSNIDAEDSQLDLIVGLGTRIHGEAEGFNVSLFGEIRAGVDELDDLKEYGRFGAGLRFRF